MFLSKFSACIGILRLKSRPELGVNMKEHFIRLKDRLNDLAAIFRKQRLDDPPHLEPQLVEGFGRRTSENRSIDSPHGSVGAEKVRV